MAGTKDTQFCRECESTSGENGNYLRIDKVQMTRIKCDLAHVDMDAVLKEIDASNQQVIVGQTLCGAGTDLALKSLARYSGSIDACVMACCCHGVCSWQNYVGRDFLISALGFCNKHEFDLMLRWTTGTTYKDQKHIEDPKEDNDDEEVDIEHGTPGSTNTQLSGFPNATSIVKALQLKCGIRGFGRACQRLIDHGRVEYMNEFLNKKSFLDHKRNFKTRMFHYIEESVTPQNLLLSAHITKGEI
eukprot:CAMPEP_0118680062 /NCGR_PEP_ID=MMETSP0800-20121206/4138_1 /TAXON_ID=210618 ORGANISM="Striatella unipunctata, Strain CCMP2910" /NCGR_SAMPLE_ID=MMETSP0800 /ASSEMBLY_ACC=CAM_ASM_000638 /LENGTH=244 /DNA_ID=CAMNT_0006576133 /DNA_START=66 /DNA_END=801 /DNA_ORIENTATION=-